MWAAVRRLRTGESALLDGAGPLRKSVLPDLALYHDLVRRAVIS
jgi:hypothetical protein